MTLTSINSFFLRFYFYSFVLHLGALPDSYPAMGTVKGAIVPEDQRAAIYNVFRFPLNLFMLAFLVGDFSTEFSFTANAVLLMVTCVLQIRLAWVGSDAGNVL
jgi:hypothetical protein